MNKSDILFYTLGIIIISSGLYTTLTTSINGFAPTDFGLVNRLPIVYWIGLVAIGLLFFTAKESLYKSSFAFIFLLLFLFVIPAVAREPVWLSNSYYPYANSLKANDIKTSIDLNQETDISTSYYYWPLFLFLASILNITTYSNEELILKLLPILTIVAIGGVSYLILKKKFPQTTSIAGASLVIASFWLRQQYFGPPAISYIFFFFALFAFSYILFKPIKFRNEIYILFILFFTSTLFTHLLTFGVFIFMLGSIFLLDRIKHIENYKPLFYITIFSGISGIIYYLRGFLVPTSGGLSVNYITWIINTLISSITNVTNLSLFKESSRIQATLPQTLNYYSSWIIVGLNGICIAYLILKFILKRFDPKSELWETFSLFLVMFLACLGVMAVALTYGPHESYQRAFMFGIFPLVYFSVTVLQKHRNVLYLTLLAIVLLNVPAQYGADNFRTATATQLSGSKFFSDFAISSTDTSAINTLSLYVRYFNPEKHFDFNSIGTLPFTSLNSIVIDQENKLNTNKFLMLSNEEYNFYYYYLGFDPINIVDLNTYKIASSYANSTNLPLYIKTNLSRNNSTEFYTSRIFDNSGYQIIRLYKTYTITYLTETKDGYTVLSSKQVPQGTRLSFTQNDPLFDHWEVNGENWGKSTTLNITASRTRFVTAVQQYGLDIQVSGQGTVGVTPQNMTYPSKTKIELYAQPFEGYKFLGWSGDLISTQQKTTITMDSNKHIVANFVPVIPIIYDDYESPDVIRVGTTDPGSKLLPSLEQDSTNSANHLMRFQTVSGSTPNYNSFNTYQLQSEIGELYVRGRFYLAPESTITNQTRLYLMRFNGVQNNSAVRLVGVGIINDGISSNWALFFNDGTSIRINPTVSQVQPGVWYFVELHWRNLATMGFAEVYIDGELVVNLNYNLKNELVDIKSIDVGISAANRQSDVKFFTDDLIISEGYVGLSP